MEWAWMITGITIGLSAGLEVARRAYRDTAQRLGRSNEILAEVLATLDPSQP